MYAAHFGISKTVEKVKSSFYWFKMTKDILIHVKSCKICNKNKTLNKKPNAALQNYVVGHPLDRVGLDVRGRLPKTMHGNRFFVGHW